VSVNEILTYLGVFVGGVILTFAGYAKKPKPPEHDAVVSGVGLELGNRHQMEMLIGETKRCADYLSIISASLAVIADRKQAAMEEKLDELLEQMREKERRN
jgi:hypothetical protein